MVKIKYDVSGSDPEKAKPRQWETPKPGIYTARIHEINPGFSKDDDGNEDKTRARLEVIYEIIDDQYKGARIWDYLALWSEKAAPRVDQFLQAFGIATPKKKRSGSFDTDQLIGLPCKIRVYNEMEDGVATRARIGDVLEGDDEDLLKTDEEEDDGLGGGDDDEGEEEDLDALAKAADDDEDDEAATRLAELAEEAGIEDTDDYPTWGDVVTAIKAANEDANEDDYDTWDTDRLRAEMTERDLKVSKKTTKAQMVKALTENDQEEPF